MILEKLPWGFRLTELDKEEITTRRSKTIGFHSYPVLEVILESPSNSLISQWQPGYFADRGPVYGLNIERSLLALLAVAQLYRKGGIEAIRPFLISLR